MAVHDKPGLREVKKRRTQEALSAAALRLFASRGYDATTVEDIAAAAEVAPRTFFRYFATKEDVLFADQETEDQLAARALGARRSGEGLGPALRRMVRELPAPSEPDAKLRQRIRLILSTPALLARATQVLAASQKRLGHALAGPKASRVERRRGRMLMGAYVGAYLAGLMAQVEAGERLDLAATAKEVLRLMPRPARGL